MLNEILHGKRIGRYIPIIGWVRSYQRAWLRDDLVSGVVVGAIMIPVAMAYAEMAGVPPQAGLYAAIAGMTAYALFATSRHLKITTSSTMSIMSLAVVAPLAAGDPGSLYGAVGRAGDHRRHHHDRPRHHQARLHLGLPGQVGDDGLHLRRGVSHRHQPVAQSVRRPRGQRQLLRAARAIHCETARNQRLLPGFGRRHDHHHPVDQAFQALDPRRAGGPGCGNGTVIAAEAERAVRRQQLSASSRRG